MLPHAGKLLSLYNEKTTTMPPSKIPPLNQHRPKTREFAVGDRPCLPSIFTEDRTLLGCRHPTRPLLRPGRRLGKHHARFTFPIWNQAMTRVNVLGPRNPAALKKGDRLLRRLANRPKDDLSRARVTVDL